MQTAGVGDCSAEQCEIRQPAGFYLQGISSLFCQSVPCTPLKTGKLCNIKLILKLEPVTMGRAEVTPAFTTLRLDPELV